MFVSLSGDKMRKEEEKEVLLVSLLFQLVGCMRSRLLGSTFPMLSKTPNFAAIAGPTIRMKKRTNMQK